MNYLIKFIVSIPFCILFACGYKTNTQRIVIKRDVSKLPPCFAFAYRDTIFYRAAGDKEIATTIGTNPELSPDGLKLAYTEYYDKGQSSNILNSRRVLIMDLKTGKKTTILSNSEQVYLPKWSYNSKKLAILLFDKSEWKIGIVDSNAIIATLNNDRQKNLHSIFWSSDNETLLTHGSDSLFFLTIANKIHKKLGNYLGGIRNSGFVSRKKALFYDLKRKMYL